MTVKTTPFDAADHLDTPEKRAAYLSVVLEESDPASFRDALNTVARAEGMTKVSKSANVTRQGLYKALGPDGDPQLSTLMGTIEALGFNLVVTAKKTGADNYDEPRISA